MDGERAVEMLLDAEVAFQNQATMSPDGRWLAYTSTETPNPRIYVRPFPNIDDGKWLVSTGLGFDPVWSPDGRELFWDNTQHIMVAQIETEPTFSARTPQPLLSTAGFSLLAAGRQYDIAPGGDRFIFKKPEAAGLTKHDGSFNGLIFVDNWFQELTERVPAP